MTQVVKHMMKYSAITFVVLTSALPAFAQTTTQAATTTSPAPLMAPQTTAPATTTTTAPASLQDKAMNAVKAVKDIVEDATEQRKASLFFTDEELDKIENASAGKIDSKDMTDPSADGEDKPAPITIAGPRDLRLAGILYHGNNDWVIWFNGMRVTPKTKPEGMLDILVRKDRIALKWLDRPTNRIINLVMYPHQEYHLDSDTITAGTH